MYCIYRSKHGAGRSGKESIAIGSEEFIEKIQRQLGSRAKGSSAVLENVGSVLKESPASYNTLFEGEKSTLRPDNS